VVGTFFGYFGVFLGCWLFLVSFLFLWVFFKKCVLPTLWDGKSCLKYCGERLQIFANIYFLTLAILLIVTYWTNFILSTDDFTVIQPYSKNDITCKSSMLHFI